MKFCPQCHLILEPMDWQNTTLDVCKSCGGRWFCAAAWNTYTAAGPDSQRELDSQLPPSISGNIYAGLQKSCPDCITEELTITENVPHTDNLIFTCGKCCGIWMESYADIKSYANRNIKDPQVLNSPAPPSIFPPVMSEPDSPVAPIIIPPISGNPASAPVVPNVQIPGAPLSPSAPTVNHSYSQPLEVPFAEETPASYALRRLMDGNARFASDRAIHPDSNSDRRRATARKAQPFAAVVSCSDSRVPPELLFDRGIGDLFIVRTPGQVMDDASHGGLEFAVEEWGIPLILVLGHSNCAAVSLSLSGTAGGARIRRITDAIQPAVTSSRAEQGDPLENATRANVRRIVRELEMMQPLFSKKIAEGKLQIQGAIYDVSTGRVDSIPDVVTESNISPITHETTVEMPQQSRAADPVIQQMPDTEVKFNYCPMCHERYRSDISYCQTCGVALVDDTYRIRCANCHQANPVSQQHCLFCQHPLKPLPPAIHVTDNHSAVQKKSSCTGAIIVILAFWLFMQIIAYLVR